MSGMALALAALTPWLQEAKLRYSEAQPLAPYTTLRIGGAAARVIDWPEQDPDGSALLSKLAELQIPARVLGAGSNLLIDDAPFAGVILRMKSAVAPQFDEEGVTAPAGFMLPRLATLAAAEGLAGLEAFAGIPGTVGGAAAMNAGAWGSEIREVFAWAEVVTAGGVQRIGLNQAGFSYRHSIFQGTSGTPPALIRRVRFILRREHPAQVRERLLGWQRRREASQPISARTAGSTWTNPSGPDAQPAWKLLDECGLRGWGVGGVRLSEKHCNFLINHGDGTSADALAVMAEAERRVHEQFGVVLQREIRHWRAEPAGGSDHGA